jgi:hypothetical protein
VINTVFPITDSVTGSVDPMQQLRGNFTRPISSPANAAPRGRETSGFLQNNAAMSLLQTDVSPIAWRVGLPIVLQTHSAQSPNLLFGALRRILEAEALPYDWDSYGGVGATKAAANRAIALILDLWKHSLLLDDPQFDVIPVPTGGIQFEWVGGNSEIEIEIDATGKLHTLIQLADGTYEESPSDPPLDWTEIRNQVLRIIGRPVGA